MPSAALPLSFNVHVCVLHETANFPFEDNICKEQAVIYKNYFLWFACDP